MQKNVFSGFGHSPLIKFFQRNAFMVEVLLMERPWGNKSREQKANHIVSAWCDMDCFCLGQKKAEKIRQRHEDYTLALKENPKSVQGNK